MTSIVYKNIDFLSKKKKSYISVGNTEDYLTSWNHWILEAT